MTVNKLYFYFCDTNYEFLFFFFSFLNATSSTDCHNYGFHMKHLMFIYQILFNSIINKCLMYKFNLIVGQYQILIRSSLSNIPVSHRG